MASKTLKNASIAILLVGLILGLPNLDTMLIDFTQFGDATITVLRVGLIGFVFYLVGDML